jgi:membrane-associated phospholipid phosphatase
MPWRRWPAGWAPDPRRARRVVGAVVAVGALLLGQGVRLLIAYPVDRPRPARPDWAAAASGPAYPSGHTTTSAVVAALICVAAARAGQGRKSRTLQAAAALCWAVLVGLTRIYLGVHWPTDVLAGWLLAALAAAAALLAQHQPITPAARRNMHGQWTSTAHEADA